MKKADDTASSPEADLLTGTIASTHLEGAPGFHAATMNREPQTCADCGRDPKTKG